MQMNGSGCDVSCKGVAEGAFAVNVLNVIVIDVIVLLALLELSLQMQVGMYVYIYNVI